MSIWYDEVFNANLRFGLLTKQTLFEEKSAFQKVTIIETEALGRALLIDDLWMTSEGDEKNYHELLVHPAMTTAPKIERILIIGGGDGGTAREVLRYPEVLRVDMVEIDGMVVDACKEFLPSIGSAWNDPRLNVVIGDGIAWVEDTTRQYDVILVDGSDPVGPAQGLFNKQFYQNCANLLGDDGVFVTQSESDHTFLDVHIDMVKSIRDIFGSADPYYRNVMLYAAGSWSWTYASRKTNRRAFIEARMSFIESQSEIYNRDIHDGVFAIPNFIKRKLSEL